MTIEVGLATLLSAEAVKFHVFPEPTEGPYHRDVHPVRRDIVEDREGLPLQLGLRLLAGDGQTPLDGVMAEIWQADKDGRYSGLAEECHAAPLPSGSSTSPRRCRKVMSAAVGVRASSAAAMGLTRPSYAGLIHCAARLPAPPQGV